MRVLATVLAILALAACGDTTDPAADAEPMQQDFYPGVPDELAAQVREAGQVIDPASYAIFEGMVDAPPYEDVTVAQDIAYGGDAAQKLDVYTANDASDGDSRRVLVFVHGGGFVGGSKGGAGYYPQNITAWAARNGMVAVNIDYRLAPDNAWPAGRDDLAAALAWVRANIAGYGGDPDDIVLFGHSAGANHVADYVTHKDMQGPEAAGVTGAVLMSPFYAEQPGEEPHVYYGSDTELMTAPPAIRRLGASSVPLLLAYAEYDPQFMQDFARHVETELCGDGSTGRCPEVLLLGDHNHLTEGAAIGSVDESFTGPFRDWLRGL